MTDAPGVAGLLDLSGRVAIVTGASCGIGAGIARRLAEAGTAERPKATTRMERLQRSVRAAPPFIV